MVAVLATALLVLFITSSVTISQTEGKSLSWRHCNGCGRNSPQESRGCDPNYMSEPASGGSKGKRVSVYPGERIDIPVKRLMERLVPGSWFESDVSHSFDWKDTGLMYYTVGVLRPTRSTVLGPISVERVMLYQEIKESELDGGVIHSYVPALDYANDALGGSETTIQVCLLVSMMYNQFNGDKLYTFSVHLTSIFVYDSGFCECKPGEPERDVSCQLLFTRE